MGAVAAHDEQGRQPRRVARDVSDGNTEQSEGSETTGLAGRGGCVMGGGDRGP